MPITLRALLFSALVLQSCQTNRSSSETKGIFDQNHSPLPVDQLNSGKVAWRPLDKTKDAITGIGVLNLPALVTNLDMCTAFLIDTHVDLGPGYIVTNAHCTLHHIGFNALSPEEVRHNEKTSFEVIFNHFMAVPQKERVRFKLSRLTYYTENETDLAIFQLEKTLGALKSEGIQPLNIAAAKPVEGTQVRLVGVPLLRVPSNERSLHITDSCQLFSNAKLRNGIYSAPNSVIHNCNSIEGFSGGPLLDKRTGEVVLINSHGDAGDSEDPPCTYASQPCEVDSKGEVHVEPTRNYGQYVAPIKNCFDSDGLFTLSAPGCELPK